MRLALEDTHTFWQITLGTGAVVVASWIRSNTDLAETQDALEGLLAKKR